MRDNDSSTPASEINRCPVCGYSYRCCDCHPDSIRAHDLNRQVAALRAERDRWKEQWQREHDGWNRERAEVERMRPVVDRLRRIARIPIAPRPDGTHNYDRAAIIRMARDTMAEFGEAEHG